MEGIASPLWVKQRTYSNLSPLKRESFNGAKGPPPARGRRRDITVITICSEATGYSFKINSIPAMPTAR